MRFGRLRFKNVEKGGWGLKRKDITPCSKCESAWKVLLFCCKTKIYIWHLKNNKKNNKITQGKMSKDVFKIKNNKSS